jgi:hypothetical protein
MPIALRMMIDGVAAACQPSVDSTPRYFYIYHNFMSHNENGCAVVRDQSRGFLLTTFGNPTLNDTASVPKINS